MLVLRGYLVIAVALLVVKTVQLGVERFTTTAEPDRGARSQSPARLVGTRWPGGGGSSRISCGTVTSL